MTPEQLNDQTDSAVIQEINNLTQPSKHESRRINYKSLYETKNIPMNYFFSVLDSPEIVQKKKAYFEKKYQTSEDTLGNLLEQNLHFEVLTLMTECHELEEMGSQLQHNLSIDLQRQLPIVSPFSKYTLTEFFYTILTNYCLEFRWDMYTVRNPENGVYSGNTSEKEFEF